MKALLDFLTLPLSLPINPIWDFVICAIIGEIAYWVAYSFAGRNASSSAGRSALHWAVRIPLYFILWLIACIIITGNTLDPLFQKRKDNEGFLQRNTWNPRRRSLSACRCGTAHRDIRRQSVFARGGYHSRNRSYRYPPAAPEKSL